MEWEMHKAYADLICEGFQAAELEALENAAEFYYGILDAHGRVTFSATCPLIIDIMAEYGDEE